VVERTSKGFPFSESQVVKGTQVSTEFYLNEYSILAALLIDCKNFCGNRSHLWHFLRLTSPEMESDFKSALRKAHQRARGASRTIALVIRKVEGYSQT
jgi:hypothetical protein